MKDDKSDDSSFAKLLRVLLEGLEWDQKTLCEKAKIQPARLSEWKSGWNAIGERDLIGIGTALFDELAKRKSAKNKSSINRKSRIARYPSLTSLVNDLLRSAGYRTLDTGLTNATWEELHNEEKRNFRIGWTPLAHYCPSNRVGIQFDIGEAVSKLLNFTPEWVEYPYQEDVFTTLMDDVRDGEIDAIGPFMFHIPSRNSRVRFTDSIGFYERFVVMAGLNEITKNVANYPNGQTQHTLCYVEEDASEVMGKLLLYSPRWESYESEAALIYDLIHKPKDENGNLRCFVTGAIDFDRLMADPDSKVLSHASLDVKLNDNQSYQFYLPTGFAVAEEEPRLADQINGCLQILKRNGYIYKYLRHKYAKGLDGKVSWEDKLDL
jgi:ABC-type amino acid transport substrate-binding protein